MYTKVHEDIMKALNWAINHFAMLSAWGNIIEQKFNLLVLEKVVNINSSEDLATSIQVKNTIVLIDV